MTSAWRISIGAILLSLLALPGTSKTMCPSIVPEIEEHVELGQFPADAARWQAAKRIWAAAASDVKATARRQIAEGGMSPAADIIQGYTHDLLREALRHGQVELVQDFTELWAIPLSELVVRDRVQAYYVNRDNRISEVEFGRPHELWVDRDNMETTLYSAIYLAGAMDIAETIAEQPSTRRGEQEMQFARRAAAVALSHYRRWAFNSPGLWQVQGWGCEGSGLTLVEFTRLRLERRLGNPAAPFCDSPTDLDLLIATGLVNLLAIAAIAPEIAAIDPDEQQRLRDLVGLQAKFFASRIVATQTIGKPGPPASTVNFDPGSWSLHGDFAYASNEQERFPVQKPTPRPGVGWDFAHGARIAWTLGTFADHPGIVGPGADWKMVREAFARQLAYHVVDGDPDLPLFRNYLDGSNGWYRVNSSGRENSGTPPYGLSRAYFHMPWARESSLDPLLMRVASGAWRLLTGATIAHCTHLQRYYLDGAYWMNGEPSGQPLTGTTQSLNLLPFLAVAPVR